MHTKLKIKIELLEGEKDISKNVKQIGYFLKITVLDIDDRFQTGEYTGDYIRFRGDYMYVKCNKNKSFGGLYDEGIILPKLDKAGFPYTKFFNTDKERKIYLKVLYKTFNDWSNYWWKFQKDSLSKIIIKDDIWEVKCDKIVDDLVYDVY